MKRNVSVGAPVEMILDGAFYKEQLNDTAEGKGDLLRQGTFLGIEYYGTEANDSLCTDTCLLCVDNITGRVISVGPARVRFTEVTVTEGEMK